jgi:uncharacterized membrane protein
MSYLAFEFEGNKFKGDILPDLMALVEKGTIRILDVVVVAKDKDGKVSSREMIELDPADVLVLNPLKSQIKGLFSTKDIQAIAEAVRPSTTAALLMIEHLWAAKFFKDVLAANGRLVGNQFVPAIKVQEAIDKAPGGAGAGRGAQPGVLPSHPT